jgi:hypothetical protein
VPQPAGGADRARRREDLLTAAERDLAAIAGRVNNGTLSGQTQSALQVGLALKRYRVELHIRLIPHSLADRVKAHVLLCMLACYLTWHLQQPWAELLFKDEHPPTHADPAAEAVTSD